MNRQFPERSKLHLKIEHHWGFFSSPLCSYHNLLRSAEVGTERWQITYGSLVWVTLSNNNTTSIQVPVAWAQSRGTKHNYKRTGKCGLAMYLGRIWHQFAEHSNIAATIHSLTNVCPGHSSEFFPRESVVQLIPPILSQGSLVNAQSSTWSGWDFLVQSVCELK